MSRSLKIYQGEDLSPVTDLTEPTSDVHVIWEEVEAGGRAYKGESSISSLPMRDERGETGSGSNLPAGLSAISLAAGNRLEWLVNGVRLFWGRVGPKDYSRGRQKADRARELTLSAQDQNYDLRGIIVDGWARGEETDVARVLALRSAYLAGSPRRTTNISDDYVAAGSNTVTLGPRVYDATNPAEILSEIGSVANKLHFVTIDDELFYDGWDSTAYPAGLRISDRLDELTTIDSSEGIGTLRLYWSTSTNGTVTPATDAAWEHDDTGGTMHVLQTSPNSSYSGGHSLTTSIGGTAGGQDVCQDRSVYGPLSADEAALIAAGGLVCRGQVRARMRFGIGIDEADQDGIAQIGVRVTQGASSTIRGTALALHALSSSAGSSKWPAAATKANKQFPPAPANNVLSAVAGCVAGDYLVVEIGCRNFTISSETSGSSLALTNNSASDLPLDDSSTDNFNSWIQFGPDESAVPTYPPIWDVGPSSTEDGMQLLSGLRLYYGQGSNTYVYVNDPVTANRYWHSEESLYTSDPLINTAARATTLANAILQRRKYEERTYNVSVGPLTDEEVNLLKPGQLIDIKARAIPDADDAFVSRRIAQLRWTTPVPGTYFAHMMLDRPIKEAPYSVGPKTATDSINRHVEQGSNSHPEYVLRGTLTTLGDLPYRGASDWTRLAIGSSNTWLKSIGAGNAPLWATLPTSSGTIAVEEDGVEESSSITRLNFTTNLDVSVSGNEATISGSGGAGGTSYFSRRLTFGTADGAATMNVNSTSYLDLFATSFYHDWDEFQATHFLITAAGQSSAAAQTITLQLTPFGSPTNPVSAGGDDLVITNTLGHFSSGWIAVSDSMAGLDNLQLAVKGSSSTVDLSVRWIDIAFKID